MTVMLSQRLSMGLIYGLLAGSLFVLFQRLLNVNGTRLKWWLNAWAAAFVAGCLSLASVEMIF
jgi:hypothetical protein